MSRTEEITIRNNMPTYEYQCKKCNYQFEELQSITARPLVECPNCHTPNLARLIGGGGGMIFKGSGFYQTDYKSKTPSGKSNSSASSSHRSNGSKKTESAAKGDSEKSGAEAKSESTKDSKEPAKKTPEKKSSGTDTTSKKD
jgi:putative FmdB family regulatory protein